MTAHSAELIVSDHYISSGSDESSVEGGGGDDEDAPPAAKPPELDAPVDIILAGSKMGLMRRGGRGAGMAGRTWARAKEGEGLGVGEGEALGGAADGGEGDAEGGDAPAATAAERSAREAAEAARLKKEEEEELAGLDPAERAARLLAKQARKLEEAKAAERRLMAEENAGRDPCLFSKRTAFDIRVDQMEDKPWARGGDPTDFFNYGMTDDDWFEYSEIQMSIRQELTDASKQGRKPDPTLIPVNPRAPRKQNPRVAVSNKKKEAEEQALLDAKDLPGPQAPKPDDGEGADQAKAEGEAADEGGKKKKKAAADEDIGAGAWGAGAAPGSVLAKLIEEQERKEQGMTPGMGGGPSPRHGGAPGYGGPPPPQGGYGGPPPPQGGYGGPPQPPPGSQYGGRGWGGAGRGGRGPGFHRGGPPSGRWGGRGSGRGGPPGGWEQRKRGRAEYERGGRGGWRR